MSQYKHQPLSFEDLKTVPIDDRGGKVDISHFARPYRKGEGLSGLLESLPKLLAADSFRGVIDALRRAKAEKKSILWGMGGHVVKCGLADVLLDLMRLMGERIRDERSCLHPRFRNCDRGSNQ